MVFRPLQLRGDLVTVSPKVNVLFAPIQSLVVWDGLDHWQLSKSMQPIGLANSQHASPHRRCVALLFVGEDVGTLTVAPDVSVNSAMQI